MSRLKGKKIFVAMSGGVDSSVAAAILKAQGYDVCGVTMTLHPFNPETGKDSGCGKNQVIEDARRVADQLGIPHHVWDFSQDLEQLVVRNFIEEYANARTPNPCVRCNRLIKFGTLFEKVRESGGDFLATGHYAQIIHNTPADVWRLQKAVDLQKDQSYFLYGLKRAHLPFFIFPLGGMTKDAVRSAAREYHLATAEKKESQDICFIPDDDYKRFIRDHGGEALFVPGDFVDENGTVVGKHQGIINYTIGQRDKLGIALGHRAYVNQIDKATNTVSVGGKDQLMAHGLIAKEMNLLSEKVQETIEARVRIRYNAKEVDATIRFLDDEKVEVHFGEPQMSVTPGQSLVIYQGDCVLGGGIIDAALKE